MKRTLSCLLLALLALPSFSQIRLLKQRKMARWDVPAANYSGITPLGNGRYAVVSDKQNEDGFFEFHISQDSVSGKVKEVKLVAFRGNGLPARDAEDIIYNAQRGTVFVCAEDDQRILEYDLTGQRTGHELQVPALFAKENIYPNYGFEALGYNPKDNTFWSTTENALRSDGQPSDHGVPHAVTLRLQQFDSEGQPLAQYYYTLDAPLVRKKKALSACGVVAITPTDDNALLVLEREIVITPKKLGSYAHCKLYRWDAATQSKTLQTEWRTKLTAAKRNLANYEGMCLGLRLKDGRQTLLFINDSQGGLGNRLFHLKDYLRVGVVK